MPVRVMYINGNLHICIYMVYTCLYIFQYSLSNECSLWYPDLSCCSKPLTNLPMASSISAASGLASIHTVYIGLHNLKPHWLCIYIACTMLIHVYTLHVHVIMCVYMFYDLHTVRQHHIYNFLPFCPMLVDRNLQFCT